MCDSYVSNKAIRCGRTKLAGSASQYAYLPADHLEIYWSLSKYWTDRSSPNFLFCHPACSNYNALFFHFSIFYKFDQSTNIVRNCDCEMVLDPISALGFTCNLLQLIDVSIKLVSKARSIHVSSNGALIENTELEVVAKDLAQLSDHTAADSSIISAPPSGRFGAFEDTFKELSQRCGEVAGELLMRLEKLKVEGKHRGWKSFRQALKSVWTKEEINAIASRLTNLRAQLDSRILFSLRLVAAVIHSVTDPTIRIGAIST